MPHPQSPSLFAGLVWYHNVSAPTHTHTHSKSSSYTTVQVVLEIAIEFLTWLIIIWKSFSTQASIYQFFNVPNSVYSVLKKKHYNSYFFLLQQPLSNWLDCSCSWSWMFLSILCISTHVWEYKVQHNVIHVLLVTCNTLHDLIAVCRVSDVLFVMWELAKSTLLYIVACLLCCFWKPAHLVQT